MSDDLISREALKKAYSEECAGECSVCKHNEHFEGCGLINNALTVEPNLVNNSQGLVKDLVRERPTGHWESVGFVGMKYAWCRCSNCHKTTKIYKDASNEFCCISDIRKKAIACLYCGADMRGDTNG